MSSLARFLSIFSPLFFLSLAQSQVLTHSNTGFVTPEAIQITGASSDFGINSLSAQDVNGDGKVDLVVARPNPSNPTGPLLNTILVNQGDQKFQQMNGNSSDCLPVPVGTGVTGSTPPFCVLADLNGDGLPDKIFAGEYVSSSNTGETDYPYIKVEYATSPGHWGTPVSYSIGGRSSFISSVAVGDFNGDGRTDIAVLRLSQTPDSNDQTQGYLFILYGNGDGFTLSHGYATGVYNSFGYPPALSNLSPSMNLVALDLNGDNKSDLLVYSISSGYSYVLGGADSLTILPQSGPSPFQIAMSAKLTDGPYSDLIAFETQQQDPLYHVHVLIGGGKGSAYYGYFARDQALSLNEYEPAVYNIVSADFNRDGRPDIAVQTSQNINVYMQETDGTFSNPTQYPTPGPFLAAADFNGDGIIDLAAAGNPLTILYGDGYGSFSASRISSNYVPHGLFGPGSLVTADFNRDGKADIATPLLGGCNGSVCSSKIALFESSGKGWFNPPNFISVPATTFLYAAGDVNGDGIPDLVGIDTDIYSPQTSRPDTVVLLGKGDASFAPAKTGHYGMASDGSDLFIRDVNNDGKMDLLTDAGVALGKGDGTFQDVIPYNDEASCCQFIAVGDFNGDGKIDVLLGNPNYGIDVLLGDGNGHFTKKTTIELPCDCASPAMAVGDLNGDGKLDLVLGLDAGEGGGILSYLGRGDGTFTLVESDSIAPSASDSYGTPQVFSLAIRDFNGDGINDVVVQAAGGIMPVFLGKGGGKFASPILVANTSQSQGSQAFAIADFNLDGAPDIAMATQDGFVRVLNAGFKAWPKPSNLPSPSPFRLPSSANATLSGGSRKP